jgi:Icc protein
MTICGPPSGISMPTSDRGGAGRLFAVPHQPLFAEEFDRAASRRLMDLLEERQVRLSIHGHQHNYHLMNLEGGKVLYLVADKVGSRNYAKVTVSGDSLAVERIFF